MTFRQLNENYSTPSLLVKYLDQRLPIELYQSPAKTEGAITPYIQETSSPSISAPGDLYAAMELINQQLQQLSQQMLNIQSQLMKDPSVDQSSLTSFSSKVGREEIQTNSEPYQVKEK